MHAANVSASRPGVLVEIGPRCRVSANGIAQRIRLVSDENLVHLRETVVQVDMEMNVMMTIASWHGTHEESLELVDAVASNCGCEIGEMGEHLTVCEPHMMLATDQRALDGLLFVRRMAERLRREEFSVVGCTTRPGLGSRRSRAHLLLSVVLLHQTMVRCLQPAVGCSQCAQSIRCDTCSHEAARRRSL